MSSITPEQRHRPSLFGPVVLIAIGLFFLFYQLDWITELHWGDVLQYWPLFLIFGGLDILVQQAPRPWGTLLSGLVAVVAVTVFGYILLVGVPSPRWNWINLDDWQTREVSFPAAGLNEAEMDIEIGPPGADLYALEDSRDLIAGTVTYHDGLLFDKQGGNGQVAVKLAPQNTSAWFWPLIQWEDLNEEARWDLGLHPDVPLSLALVATAGVSDLDMRGLVLQDLSFNLSAGEATLFLPGGDYDMDLEVNAATETLTLPESGEHKVELNVNAGTLTINLPAGMEARIEVDRSLGGFEVQNSRLQLQSGSDNIWQTAGYENSDDRVNILLHIDVGSALVNEGIGPD